MVKADGAIYINTEIDSDGFKAGGKEIEAAARRMAKTVSDIGEKSKIALRKQTDAFVKQNQMYAQQEQKVKSLENKLRELSEQKVETDELKNLNSEIKKTEQALDRVIERQIKFVETGGDIKSRAFEGMEYDIEQLNKKLDEARQKKNQLEASGLAYAVPDTSTTEQKLLIEKQKLAQMNTALGTSYESLKSKVNGYKKETDKAERSTRKIGKTAKRTNISLGKMLFTSILFSAVFRAISAVTNGAKEGLNNLAQYSSETNKNMSALVSALAQLKNSFATAFSPILSVVTPALVTLINLLSQAATYAAQLFSVLQGKSTFTKATKVQKDYAESLKGTGEAADKAAGSLSSYDKLNSIQKDAGGTEVNPEIAFEEEEVSSGIVNAIDKVKEKFAELKDLFKNGFDIGFSSNSFQPITDNIQRIKDSLKNIFSDPSVQSAASRFVDSFALNLGKVIGSVASIGTTIASNITGGIAKYLEENTGRIKTYLISMFDIGTDISEIIGNFAVAFAEIFSVFAGENGVDLTSHLIAIFVNPIMTVTQLMASVVRDGLNLITQPVIENKEKIMTALDGLLGILATLTGTVSDFLTNIGDSVLATYEQYISPAIQNITDGISQMMSVGLDLWNNFVAPFLQDTADKVRELMSKYISPFVSKLIKFGGQIVEIISLVWKKWLVPLWSWIAQKLIPVFTKLASHIVDNFNYVGQQIGVIVNMAMDILNGLAEFIAGVLTNDFERAGNGIRDIFKGVINGIIEFFENGINFIVKNLNKLKFTVPEWVPEFGGKSIGFNLSQVDIPRLATGAVIPPNSEFLAVLGDQKHGTNIETPLDTMVDAFKQALREMNNGGTEKIELTMMLDSDTLEKKIIEINRKHRKRTGKPLLT